MASTIGLLYDPHIIADDRREHDGVSTARAAIRHLNDIGVDWTVVGGDLTQLARASRHTVDWGGWDGDPDNPYYRADFERAREVLDDGLDNPYFAIRGNVDRPLHEYQAVFPPDEHPQWHWFAADGARYVFLDSNPHEGYHHLTECQNFISSPQLAMLERLMDRDPDIPTFVFVHAPLARHTEFHDDWDSGIEVHYYLTRNHPTVRAVLERGNTVFVNSGHYYKAPGRGSVVVNDIEYVIARHLTRNPDPDWAGDVRWLTVDPDDRAATVHYRDLSTGDTGEIAARTW